MQKFNPGSYPDFSVEEPCWPPSLVHLKAPSPRRVELTLCQGNHTQQAPIKMPVMLYAQKRLTAHRHAQRHLFSPGFF